VSEKKVASFEELEKADDTEYDTVEAYGITTRIGSLCSADMIEWVESNDDKDKRKEAGLRILVKSVVDEDGNRIPKDKHEHFLEVFRRKGTKSNGKMVDAILRLNGLRGKGAVIPNALSEEATDTSLTGSPSQPVG